MFRNKADWELAEMYDFGYKRRHPILAAILSLFGGAIGQLYAGRGRRCIVLLVVTLMLAPVVGLASVVLPCSQFVYQLFLASIFIWPIFLVVDAFLCARRAQQEWLEWYQRWWVYPLVYFGFIVVYIGASELKMVYVAETFVIPTGAMSPAILPGDRIVVSKIVNESSGIDYGNVVVFRSEETGEMHVKRVIALGGDTIEIKNESVYVNDRKIDEPYAIFEGEDFWDDRLVNTMRTTIPAEHFFVLADNRRRSLDSRIEGAIPNSAFCGQAVCIYWSQPHEFIDPERSAEFRVGPIAWERIGMQIQ